jgi:Protein of unknown function (DUF3052)
MLRPEVIAGGPRPEDEERLLLGDHLCHDTAVERHYTTPLLDKLGVRPGGRIAILGIDEPTFQPLLGERTIDVTEGPPSGDAEPFDLIFLGADSTAELAGLDDLRARLQPAGAIWVVSVKGKTATLRDVDVIEAAKAAGLVDNKVVSFSPTHTALRLVIARANRPPNRPR